VFSTAKNAAKEKQNNDPVVIEILPFGSKVFRLNRPAQLNSLNLEMVRTLVPRLLQHEQTSRVIFIQGTGSKAFCAGGDIISVLNDRLGDVGTNFFKEEYHLNHLLGTSPLSIISILDGIVMGGGVGLSVHGRFRLATENTLFAMPETAIGFFPDVGGSYFLPRLPIKGLGMWLALTGARLNGADCLHAGIATHYIHQADIEPLKAYIDGTYSSQQGVIAGMINTLAVDVKNLPPASFEPHVAEIEKCFGPQVGSVDEIMKRLKGIENAWSEKQLAIMRKMCPTSLLVTFEQLRRGEGKKLGDCLQMEYGISQYFMHQGTDFVEGVTAKLREKRDPVWKPKTIEEVDPREIQRYFDFKPTVWSPMLRPTINIDYRRKL
jgi:3-hydroxyisobutyryl-CoA hydrolase